MIIHRLHLKSGMLVIMELTRSIDAVYLAVCLSSKVNFYFVVKTKEHISSEKVLHALT